MPFMAPERQVRTYPRHSTGASSRALDMAFAYRPPIAMPKRARTPRNCLKVWVKPVHISKTMKSTWFTIHGHFRPYRSQAAPNVTAPTTRNINTSPMPQVMSAFDLPNVLAIGVTVRETVKTANQLERRPRMLSRYVQSKASQLQPRKPNCWSLACQPSMDESPVVEGNRPPYHEKGPLLLVQLCK